MADEILKKEPVAIGQKVIDLIKLAWISRRPIILNGPHGLGKSEIVKEAAEELEIKYLCMDLSIMEPPDLVGMPIPDKELGITKYLPPASLPRNIKTKGKGKKGKEKITETEGLLCFEELNRCGQEMQAPCLQLLTERKLNDYEVPDGWSMIACINPSNSEDFNYMVNELDPALKSRFMEINVCAGKSEWLEWANDSDIDEAVVQVVSDHPDPFHIKNGVPPRTWKYISDILQAFVNFELNELILKDAILGYVSEEWAMAITQALYDLGRYDKGELIDDDEDAMIDPGTMDKKDKWPNVKELVSRYTKHGKKVKTNRQSIKNANMELVASQFNEQYENSNQSDTYDWCEHVMGKQQHLSNLNKLFKDVGNSGRQSFSDSLSAVLREKIKIDMDITDSYIKNVEIANPDLLRETMGGLTKPRKKRGRPNRNYGSGGKY